MLTHNKETQHPIAFSFSDASFWCYECQAYITSQSLSVLRRIFSELKFRSSKEGTASLSMLLASLNIQESPEKEIST